MNELLQKLNTAHRICIQANEHYTAIDGLRQQINETQAKAGERKGKRILQWVCFILFIVVCETVVLPPLKSISKDLATYTIPVLWILYIIAFLLIRSRYRASVKEKISGFNQQIEEHNAAAQRIFDANAEQMAFLPSDYWYPIATDYLMKMLQTGRAATLSEALDKYDEQLHRWKLEDASAQVLAMQQQQAAHLANIQRNTGVSAVADVVTAAINISNSL